jgi:hypothetical protein
MTAYGITEPYWDKASFEFKMGWGIGISATAFIAGMIMNTKTGFWWIDLAVGLLTASLPITVVLAQRSFSKLKPTWRSVVTRVCVIGGTNAATALGLTTYLAIMFSFYRAVVPVLFTTFSTVHSPLEVLQLGIFSAAFLAALVVAPLNAFRGTKLEQLIRDEPKKYLISLLVRRRFVADNVCMFALFELGTLWVSLSFSSLAVGAIKIALTAPAVA